MIDIHYAFGLKLPLLLTERELSYTVRAAKLGTAGSQLRSNAGSHSTWKIGDVQAARILFLPREIRELIYVYVLSDGINRHMDTTNGKANLFCSGIGDPTGFYFPLGRDLAVSAVNHQIREEILPLYYRTSRFHLDSIDAVIQLLVAVGSIGRQNIQSLSFAWESTADDSEELLPYIHTTTCTQLLKQCTRLRSLRVYLDHDLFSDGSLDTYADNDGLRELSTLSSIENFEMWNSSVESVRNGVFAVIQDRAILDHPQP